jgi:signal transduction histidine kinase
MRRFSFRWQLWFALGLWTIGGFLLVHGISADILYHLPFIRNISHGLGFFVFAAGLMIAGLTYGRTSIARLRDLRDSVAEVRDGHTARVAGRYPSEVQPLVDELNALLEHRDRVVQRAKAKAADLAHGLKTPLALLAREAAEARARGEAGVAAAIDEQIERMRRQVEYHLAQARAAASGVTPGVRCVVLEAADGVLRALRRIYADKAVSVETRVQPAHVVRCQREDLEEMLGNLLDNAFKWARSRITVESSIDGDRVIVTVDDDGPGIAPAQRAGVLDRGVRVDESVQGTGLGLAIVRDLAELYGGSIALAESPLGGLRAVLRLPAG